MIRNSESTLDYGYFQSFQKKLSIDDETEFCDEDILASILNSKVRWYLYITAWEKVNNFLE